MSMLSPSQAPSITFTSVVETSFPTKETPYRYGGVEINEWSLLAQQLVANSVPLLTNGTVQAV